MKSTDALAELASDPDALPEIKSLFEQLAALAQEDIDDARKTTLNEAEAHYMAPVAELLTQSVGYVVRPESFEVLAAIQKLAADYKKKKQAASDNALQVVHGRQKRQEGRKKLAEAIKLLGSADLDIEVSDMSAEEIAERGAGRN